MVLARWVHGGCGYPRTRLTAPVASMRRHGRRSTGRAQVRAHPVALR